MSTLRTVNIQHPVTMRAIPSAVNISWLDSGRGSEIKEGLSIHSFSIGRNNNTTAPVANSIEVIAEL